MAKKVDINDAALDEILAQVGDMAEALAKSESKKVDLKKDEGDKKPEDSKPEAPADAPADDASAAPSEGSAPAEGPGDGEAPAADAAPQGAPGEGDPAGQGPMSDEELQQIYGSMDPGDLERHYMVIRQILQGHYSDGQGQEAAPAPGADAGGAPSPQAPAMKAEMAGQKNGGGSGGIPSAEGGVQTKKSEASATEIALRAELDSMKGQMEHLVTALEKTFKPKQKAITGIEYISKSEIEKEKIEPSKLSREEKKVKLTEIAKSEKKETLSSEDRQAITRFFLDGEDSPRLDKIISGGK